MSFLELSVQSFVCCIGQAPRIKGNSVVPELGFFFFFFFSLPSPATLSLSNLFGLQISFPNSVSAVLLSEQFSRAKSTWAELRTRRHTPAGAFLQRRWVKAKCTSLVILAVALVVQL